MSRPTVYAVGALYAWLGSVLFYSVLGETELVVDILAIGGLTFVVIGFCFGDDIFTSKQAGADDMRQREEFAARIAAYGGRSRTALPTNSGGDRRSPRSPAQASFLSALCVAICIGSIVGITGGLLASDNLDMALLASGAGFFGLIAGSLAGGRHGHR